MERTRGGDSAPFYDTDTSQSYKPTLTTGMLYSPIKYSAMRSNTARFQGMHGALAVPFGVYNTDTAHKKSIASDMRDTRRFYASSFDSEALRFPRPWSSPAADNMYDITKLKDAQPATVERSLAWSPQSYAILRSRYPRFLEMRSGEGSDVVYDIDTGHKRSLYTAMLESPRRCKNVGAMPVGASLAKGGAFTDRASRTAHLGPGAYDYPRATDIEVSPTLEHRPLSSMASRTPRFGARRGQGGQGLGTTWTQEKDIASWSKKGSTISKAEYLRPQYMPKSYMTQQKEG